MSACKVTHLSYEQVATKLTYDPDTGALIWRVNVAKNIKAGDSAGCFKGVRVNKKTGREVRYLYVRLDNTDTPAARLVWLLSKGEWPDGNVLFVDDDPSNLRLNNLRLARFPASAGSRGEKKTRKMSFEAQRHYGLKRYYGLSLQEYGEKLLAQSGVCAICLKGETAVMHGKVKPLSVDHAHGDGKIRDLLCSSCNHLLGHAREDREILLSAVKYLDKHAGKEAKAPNLTIVGRA